MVIASSGKWLLLGAALTAAVIVVAGMVVLSRSAPNTLPIPAGTTLRVRPWSSGPFLIFFNTTRPGTLVGAWVSTVPVDAEVDSWGNPGGPLYPYHFASNGSFHTYLSVPYEYVLKFAPSDNTTATVTVTGTIQVVYGS